MSEERSYPLDLKIDYILHVGELISSILDLMLNRKVKMVKCILKVYGNSIKR